jgi:hypothetical protein
MAREGEAKPGKFPVKGEFGKECALFQHPYQQPVHLWLRVQPPYQTELNLCSPNPDEEISFIVFTPGLSSLAWPLLII